jgi:gas vesicle protein
MSMKTSLIFLLGMGMGTVLGILIAPEAGKITRRKIRDEADRIIDQALQKKRLEDEARAIENTLEPVETTIVTESRYTI